VWPNPPFRVQRFAIDQGIHADVVAHHREPVPVENLSEVRGVERRFESFETLHHLDQFRFSTRVSRRFRAFENEEQTAHLEHRSEIPSDRLLVGKVMHGVVANQRVELLVERSAFDVVD
jgi:hypothetical protein